MPTCAAMLSGSSRSWYSLWVLSSFGTLLRRSEWDLTLLSDGACNGNHEMWMHIPKGDDEARERRRMVSQARTPLASTQAHKPLSGVPSPFDTHTLSGEEGSHPVSEFRRMPAQVVEVRHHSEAVRATRHSRSCPQEVLETEAVPARVKRADSEGGLLFPPSPTR